MEFTRLPQAERDAFDVLTGHVGFGVHLLLSRAATCVTMLRDPVDRLVSHYAFTRQEKDHYLHEVATSPGMTLGRYVSTVSSFELDNDQVRWLSGVPHFDVPVREMRRSHLEQAKFNLEHGMAAFGLLERLEESLDLLGWALGGPRLEMARLNQTRERPAVSDISAEDLEAIRTSNALDVELYAFARRIFSERAARLQRVVGPRGRT